jgi:L,D-transpeptidase YnhG
VDKCRSGWPKWLLTGAVVWCLGSAPQPALAQAPANTAGLAEARLIEIYQLIGAGQNSEALVKSQKLATELPHFQLAQLVYGDLLAARTRFVRTVGDVPEDLARIAGPNLTDLREESQRRIQAIRERPLPGTVPSQFVALSAKTKHAIAVDASRSRLYLFENSPAGMRLISDYYISVGKAGLSKTIEGDQRTPLGVYYITSNLDKKSLKDFYGAGALPINYPNVLDLKRGKTGSGIWLHGTPPNQFARAPLATDGCVVLTNPDLDHILRTVEVRSTPVVIADRLQWEDARAVRQSGGAFEAALRAWRNAKTLGDVNQVLSFYAPDFRSNGRALEQWIPQLKDELAKTRGRTIELKDLSLLHWSDTAETMVVTFGEVPQGTRTGRTKRQYWVRNNDQWKIFFEGSLQ